jgi:hypothetical protein
MNGEYNVLDIAAAQQGARNRIWHGWTYARKHREEFEERRSVILGAARRQLAGFRIFVTDMAREPWVLERKKGVLERLEASIMNDLYRQPSPICEIPDRGMHLASRRDSENPIIVRNNCAVLLHGLPALLEI